MPVSSRNIVNRLRLALPIAVFHLAISLLLVCAVAALIFLIWFPPPFDRISGGQSIFWLLVGVDAVSGPILTLMLFRPTKTKLAWGVDLSLIIFLQVAALAYGLFTLSQARPIAIVYEVDRFRVISYADIAPDELQNLPPWVNPFRFNPPKILGLRMANNLQEKLSSVDSSLQGVEPSQRPRFWQDYQLSVEKVLERSLPIDVLRALHPREIKLIEKSARFSENQDENSHAPDAEEKIRWLPVVSRHATDWVVLIDASSGELLRYIHLNGFNE